MYKLDIRRWGPAGWAFMKSVAFTYPERPTEQDKHFYRAFFQIIGDVLPCKACREHYKQNMEARPLRLESRRTLAEWVTDIENAVRVKNGKSEVPFVEVVAEYMPPKMRKTVMLTDEEESALLRLGGKREGGGVKEKIPKKLIKSKKCWGAKEYSFLAGVVVLALIVITLVIYFLNRKK